MPDFLDSNVIIGYHFPLTDGWGDAANVVFSRPDKKYTGTYVWEECFGTAPSSGRCETIKRRIRKEFRKTLAALRKGTEVNDLLKIIVNNYDVKGEDCLILRILLLIAEKSKNDRILIIQNLDKAKIEYEDICFKRCQEMNDRSRLTVHRRVVGHRDIWDKLCKYISDKDDVEVLIDAHDVALAPTDILFFTGDGGDIKRNKPEILKITRIADIHYLGDIAPNYNPLR